MARGALAVLAAASSSCRAPVEPDSAAPGQRVYVGGISGVILPAAAGARLLEPCSRRRPAEIQAAWQPALRDVEALEARLPALVRSHRECFSADASDQLRLYRRQYTGFWRGSERYVYANFVPAGDIAKVFPESWLTGPVGYCDGGHEYFGAEFNLDSGEFTAFQFDHDYSGWTGPCAEIRPGG